MSKLVIFGIGDVAELAHYYFTNDSEHEIVAFSVDKAYRKESTFLDLPLVDFEQIHDHFPSSNYKMFIATGYSQMNSLRARKYYKAKELGYELVSYVSSKCTWLTDYPIGDNCLILEDNTIQPFVRIGSNVILWSGNHIGHHSIIDNHCFIASHIVISGHCHIGQSCFIGVNATIRNSINIAPETLIGAGAIVMKNTIEKGVYLPERSKLFKKKSDEINL